MAVTCRQCGNPLNNEARFCSVCGTPVTSPEGAPAPSANPSTSQGYGTSYAPNLNPSTTLVRPRAGRMIAGVCEGLAQRYVWDVVWVRVVTVLLAIFAGGIGLVGYIVFWIVMPEERLALPQPTAWPPPQG